METLLNYGAEAKNTHLKTSLFYKEDLSKEAALKKVNGGPSFIKKRELFNGSRKVPFSTQLYVDFFNQRRLLPANVSVKIRLIRNEDNFSIISDKTGSPYKIKLDPRLRLIVRKIQPSLEMLAYHKRLFATKKAVFLINQCKITTRLIGRGEQTVDLQSVASGILPSQMMLVMVDHAAYSSSLKMNPFHFKNFGLTNLTFKVNGEAVPSDGFKMNFETGDYVRLYKNLLESIGCSNGNNATDLSFEDFKSNSCILSYDGSADMCNMYHSHTSKPGVIDVAMTFKEPLERSITIISFATYQKVAYIDDQNNCTVEHQV